MEEMYRPCSCNGKRQLYINPLEYYMGYCKPRPQFLVPEFWASFPFKRNLG